MQFAIFPSNFAAEGGHAGDDFLKKALGKVKDTQIAMKPKNGAFLWDYNYVAVAFREAKIF